ncbi:MotA/TolQ/ExbB proton channel family protein [Verrucomicrobiaceae bacterium N1E253]|uniref:MotA/TolQ/ExbB proton channel family protein n=1 Tax=Oceaniferula marina TaxID=2748318 RepID=A0A851GIC4_9BACT|nr:MotA/TolQ/ExbB proton channel family protein [Oceaniferula marina]NWK57106.1 MotA/TolQ/ExbB proton channel family protein [Oceaniferula marina]
MKYESYRSLKTVAIAGSTALMSTSSLFAATEDSLLQKYVIAGGWPMILIGLLILALIALCVFNFMNLSKTKFCPDDLKAGLMDHMMNCRVRSAIELGASHPSYLGRMMAYALPNVDARRPEDLGRDYVEDAIADFTINENRKSMTLINYISLIAQTAPMLGLFGTVLGMVGAFGTLASGDGSADPSALAGDISVALLTTLWGLVTAIPSLTAYFFFKNKLNNLVAECHHSAEELLNASIQTVNGDAHLAKIPEGVAV